MAEVNQILYKVRVDTGTGKVQIDGLTQGFVNTENAVKSLNKTLDQNNAKLRSNIDKTGLAGATVVELGRTISDANFGFTAMANNISQLSTLFTTLIVTTGGVANGLKAVWAALRGPLGIIVAFQAFVAVMERVAINSKRSNNELKDLDTTIKNLSESLDLQLEKLDTFGRWATSGSNELDTLKREFKELGAFLDSLTEEEQKNQDVIQFAIDNQMELLRLRKEQAVVTEKLKSEDGDRNELLIQLAKLEADESKVLTKLLPQKREELELTNKTNKARLSKERFLYTVTKFLRKEDLESLEEYWERRQEIEKNNAEAEEFIRQRALTNQIQIANSSRELLGGIADFAQASSEREITIERNKTNQINNQLKERLRNESLSAAQRKNIQNQIAKNDDELRKKQELIERKKFQLQKAANIAEATINTYAAAAGVLRDTPGGSIARIAGMIATIGAGLAQVAAIAKQKFETSAANLTGGVISVDSGGIGQSSPSFNIVGQSATNQLAQAVSGQLSQPVKAYLTTKDVLTADEMERNTIGNASLG